MVTLEHLHALAEARLKDVPDGEPLDALTASLVSLGVAASVTSLNEAAIEDALQAATAAGASVAQLEETVALVSGLGVHSLMVSAPLILRAARVRGGSPYDGPLDAARQALWQQYVGDDPFWVGFEREMPGFLEALLRLAPDTFRAFFDYCAVPWKSATVPGKAKELISLATDANPTHLFLPGFRLHLNNAIGLGVGRRAILDTLAIAAARHG